jgi:glutamine amidotransferase PdxT
MIGVLAIQGGFIEHVKLWTNWARRVLKSERKAILQGKRLTA